MFDPRAQEKLDIFFLPRAEYARTPNNDAKPNYTEGATPLPNETGFSGRRVSEVDGVTLRGPPGTAK